MGPLCRIASVNDKENWRSVVINTLPRCLVTEFARSAARRRELGDPRGSDNVLEFDGSNGEFVRVFASRDDWAWPAEINFRDGLLYVSDFRGGGTVTRFDAFTGDFVDVFISNLGGPDGQAWDDKGNIYISQFGPSRVSLHDGENGAFIENFIRSNAGGLNGPLDNLFLPAGTFLVSNFNSNRVKHYERLSQSFRSGATLDVISQRKSANRPTRLGRAAACQPALCASEQLGQLLYTLDPTRFHSICQCIMGQSKRCRHHESDM